MKEIQEFLIEGNAEKVKELVKSALDSNISPKEILDNGLIAGMDVVGRRFKNNEIFIPEVLIAAEAMNEALELIEPHLARCGVQPKGKVVVGTVKGDLHDIGKNLVTMMLKGAGFSVVDCGIDAAPQKFIDKIKVENATIVALSCLITTSMPSMAQTIEELKKQDIRDRVKIMVGGAPITQGFADQIGADGYGKDAASAVTLAKEFLGKTNGAIQKT